MIRFTALVAVVALLAVSSVSHAAARSCDLTFRVGSSVPMSSTSLQMIYQNALGDFPGDTTNVSCQLLNGTLGQIADASQVRQLIITVVGTPSPFQGPKDVAKCVWTPVQRDPVVSDFNMTAQLGFTTTFQPTPPNFTMSKIECTGDFPVTTTTTTTTTTTSSTTTSSTTSTTLQLCGDVDGNGKNQTSDSLKVLRAGVGQQVCALCICDMDGNAKVNTTDALVSLKTAVGTVLTLKCPLCSL